MLIGKRPYIDGGTVSNTSADLLSGEPVDEVYVLAPMAPDLHGRPRSPIARLEHVLRSRTARGVRADVERLREAGTQVTLITPGPADLAVMGTNLMDSRRRTAVLDAAERNVMLRLGGDPVERQSADPA